MIRPLVVVSLLGIPLACGAQQLGAVPPAGNRHAMHVAVAGATPLPSEPGQGAFAAIQEIVDILSNDPTTDWSRVDIDALRRHLVDMSNVTLHAEITSNPVTNGLRFTVAGTGPVRESIRRMIPAHAATMSGHGGMIMVSGEDPRGATLTVTVSDPAELPRLKGLGFFGVMATGMHHQAHHLAIASGNSPHRH